MHKACFEVYNVTQEALGTRVARRSSAAGRTGSAARTGARFAAGPRAGGRAAVPGPVTPSGLRLHQPAGRGQREEAAKAEIFLVHQPPLCGMGLESVGVRLTEAELRC